MHGILEATQLPLQCWNYFGFFPYYTKDLNGVIHTNRWSLHSVISGILQSLNLVYSIWSYYWISQEIIISMSLMEYCTINLCCILHILKLSANIAIRKIYNKEKMVLLNKLIKIINEIDQFNGKFEYRRLKKMSKLILIWAIVSTSYHFAILLTGCSVDSWILSGEVFGLYTMLEYLFSSGQYAIFISIIKEILRKMNGHLLTLGRVNDCESPGCDKIRILRMLSMSYGEVFQCSRIINLIFSQSILLRFGTLFTLIVLQIFNLPVVISCNKLEYMFCVHFLCIVSSTVMFCSIELGMCTIVTEIYINEVNSVYMLLLICS